MKWIFHILAVAVTALSLSRAFAIPTPFEAPEVPDFKRYQSILDRMPFGAAPAVQPIVVNPIDQKTAAQEMKDMQMLARKINMSCVNITPSGTPAVGFSDLSSKPPMNFYLLVGASGGGWTLKSASYEEEWAELEKDGTTIFVKLGKGLMIEPPAKKEAIQPIEETPSLSHHDNSAEIELDSNRPKSKNRIFKTVTEQMMALNASVPPGTMPPPLPPFSSNLHSDAERALASISIVEEGDTDEEVAYKAVVEESKDELAVHLSEGGNTQSYFKRLQQRQAEEALRIREERLAQHKDLTEFARRAAEDAIDRQKEKLLLQVMEANVEVAE